MPRRAVHSPGSDDVQPLGSELEFMQLLWAVAHGLESTSKRMLADVGVTGPQRLVLRMIGHFGRPSAGELATALHVHPSSLTGVLRRLEQATLLRRRRDPNDGRRAILTLTPRGAALNELRAGTVEMAVHRALRSVSPARATATREVLTALARELGVAPPGQDAEGLTEARRRQRPASRADSVKIRTRRAR